MYRTVPLILGPLLDLTPSFFFTPQIRQHLLSNSQKSLIRRIYSHPEVMEQCKRWLDNNYPGVELINVSSTANAAKFAPFFWPALSHSP